jgi:hypothetical protein
MSIIDFMIMFIKGSGKRKETKCVNDATFSAMIKNVLEFLIGLNCALHHHLPFFRWGIWGNQGSGPGSCCKCGPQNDHMERSDLAKRFFIARWERERERESQERARERSAGA